ncbi:hypothetical protein [Agromyces sp. ZXT2-6]|uniref:hypothetical protein n=1 Tax=Agromyces sp. ZXT2-6 TaxID=3461153 RepID=UPI004054CC0C
MVTDQQRDPDRSRGEELGVPLDPGSDGDPRPLDEDADERDVDSAEADRRAAEDGTIGDAHDVVDRGTVVDDR